MTNKQVTEYAQRVHAIKLKIEAALIMYQAAVILNDNTEAEYHRMAAHALVDSACDSIGEMIGMVKQMGGER